MKRPKLLTVLCLVGSLAGAITCAVKKDVTATAWAAACFLSWFSVLCKELDA